MANPSGPIPHHAPATSHYKPATGHQPRHATAPALPRRRKRGHRTARPYLARLPEPETLVLPVITDDTAPPAPTTDGHRMVGPWLGLHEHTAPADDMAELRTLTRRLIAQRPDLAHPAHDLPGVQW